MSITTALKARRESLRSSEDGFTLIELLVVVIIIGVLAAIAIPIYIGVQNNAKDKAAQSDLTNARTAIVAYYTEKSAFPATSTFNASNADTGLGKYGFPAASGTVTGAAVSDASTPAGTIDAFCLKAKSDSNTWFYVTQTGSPTSTKPSTCIAG